MTPPSTETLVRWLIAVGGAVTGVGLTVTGSWISSRIHVYQENRKVHLDEIKQRVLVPLHQNLEQQFAALVTHKSSAVLQKWGTRKRLEGASVVDHQTEEGPFLILVLPVVRDGVDSALYADAKKKHFAPLIQQVETLDEAWRTHATKCHAWVVRLSDEILAKSGLKQSFLAAPDESFVDPYKLGLFIYRRLFRVWERSLTKYSPTNPPTYFVLEGFEGTSARGTDEQLTSVVTLLNELMVAERSNADELIAEAQRLDQTLAVLMAEIDYAIAYRRLRKRCDLVPFF